MESKQTTQKDFPSVVRVHDKDFVQLLSRRQIQSRILELAKEISADFRDKDPLLIGILNGAFIFAADLVRNMTIDPEISFIKVATYENTSSTGTIKNLIGINEAIRDRHILIVEDIIDSGLTLKEVTKFLHEASAASIDVVTLLLKPDAFKGKLHVRYCGFEIPNRFVVGFGLDYNGKGRKLEAIYQLSE